MTIRRRQRELEGILEKVGAVEYTMEDTTGSHIQIKWTDARGRRHIYYASGTPSDWRVSKKILSDLRRMANGEFHDRSGGAAPAR